MNQLPSACSTVPGREHERLAGAFVSLEQTVAAEAKWPRLSRDELRGLPAGEHAAADEPEGHLLNRGVARPGRRQGRMLGAEPLHRVGLEQPRADDRPPEVVDRGSGHGTCEDA